MIIYAGNKICDLSKAEEISVSPYSISIHYPQGIVSIKIHIEREEVKALTKFIAENLHKEIAMNIVTLLSLALGKKYKKANKD